MTREVLKDAVGNYLEIYRNIATKWPPYTTWQATALRLLSMPVQKPILNSKSDQLKTICTTENSNPLPSQNNRITTACFWVRIVDSAVPGEEEESESDEIYLKYN